MRIFLALKGIDLDTVSVDLANREQHGEAYSRLNPQRMLPCLELEDGRVIAQSLAIIDYLDRLHPEPAIWPADPVLRAQVYSLCLLLAAEAGPLQSVALQRRLKDAYGLNEAQVADWLAHWVHRTLRPVEGFLAGRAGQTPYATGDKPGLLEAFLLPQMRNCERFGIDVSGFPLAVKLNNLALAYPLVAKAHPEAWI